MIAPAAGGDEALRAVLDSRTPLVVMEREFDLYHTHFIGFDNVAVGTGYGTPVVA